MRLVSTSTEIFLWGMFIGTASFKELHPTVNIRLGWKGLTVVKKLYNTGTWTSI
jgi:hypothetical protein